MFADLKDKYAAVRGRQETESHRVFTRDILFDAMPRAARPVAAHQSATEEMTVDADQGLGRLGRRPM